VNQPSSPAPEPGYLRGLNDPQREAVLTTEGPVLVLAGAGTGKTAALTARLAHLIATRRAWPSEILSVTFTNKAAREMKERVGRIVGDAVEGMPWLGTFHAIGAKMLRRHAELVGLQANFTILDTDDQLRLLKQLIAAADIDEKRWPARALAGYIDRWKNRGWEPRQVDAGESEAYANGKGASLYAAYQERLKTLNACDFGDLLLHMLTILKSHRDVLEFYQQRFKYFLVDEYQDTNQAQYLWLRLLAQERKNICCVGDDDQSIYSWRGAEVANILRFEIDFPGAKIIRLEQNYRSTPHILAAASGVIAQNSGRLGKTLWTEQGQGEKVSVDRRLGRPEEARRIGEEIETLQRRGTRLDNVAILVRAQFQTRELEDRFIAIGLPTASSAASASTSAPKSATLLPISGLIAQPGRRSRLRAHHQHAQARPWRQGGAEDPRLRPRTRRPLLSAAAQMLDTDELTPQARRALGNLVGDFARWRSRLDGSLASRARPPRARRIRLHAMLQADRSAESAGRLENLTELTRAMEEYETLGAFLEHVSLVMDNEADRETEKVTIMTIHAAKAWNSTPSSSPAGRKASSLAAIA
jgi:DNA helicase-2/ATP-dependent DNA helicase PcrA